MFSWTMFRVFNCFLKTQIYGYFFRRMTEEENLCESPVTVGYQKLFSTPFLFSAPNLIDLGYYTGV